MDGNQIFFRLVNPLTRAIARSPLHPLISDNIVVLIFPGIKSGRIYSIPVSYLETSDKEIICLTDRPYIWWRNLLNNKNIQILFKGKLLNANVEIEFENECVSTVKLMRILQTWGSEIISQLRKTSWQHHRK